MPTATRPAQPTATRTPYRLLAIDMDGTALTSQKTVLPSTREAIADLLATGVSVAFCTGRNPAEMREARALFPPIRYGVLVSGALVYDFAEERAISQTPLPQDLLLEAVEAGQAAGAGVHILAASGSYMSADTLDHPDRYHMGVYRPLFHSTCTSMDDPAAYVREKGLVACKCNLYHPSAEARALTRQHLEALPLALADAEATSLECTAAGVNKGQGLSDLVAHLGMSPTQAVAIGDSYNDLDALRTAGLSVAMGNATPEVKAACDLVVADNDHDGIAEAIRRVFGV